jgi:hypothetical protein
LREPPSRDILFGKFDVNLPVIGECTAVAQEVEKGLLAFIRVHNFLNGDFARFNYSSKLPP